MRVPWQNKYTLLAFVEWGKLWKNTRELLSSIISTIELLVRKLKNKHSIFGNKFIKLNM